MDRQRWTERETDKLGSRQLEIQSDSDPCVYHLLDTSLFLLLCNFLFWEKLSLSLYPLPPLLSRSPTFSPISSLCLSFSPSLLFSFLLFSFSPCPPPLLSPHASCASPCICAHWPPTMLITSSRNSSTRSCAFFSALVKVQAPAGSWFIPLTFHILGSTLNKEALICFLGYGPRCVPSTLLVICPDSDPSVLPSSTALPPPLPSQHQQASLRAYCV